MLKYFSRLNIIYLSVFVGFSAFFSENFLSKNDFSNPKNTAKKHFLSENLFQNTTQNNVTFNNTNFAVDTSDNFLKKCVTKVADFHESLPTEKIYFHLDKPFYKPEETIWGQLYVLNDVQKASDLSEIAYVELHNSQGNILEKKPAYLSQGTSQFTFELPKIGGMYKIIAYTNWLKNQGKEVFFEKNIQVQHYFNPKLLLKIDFLQKGYGAGSQVEATFEAKDLAKNPLQNKEVKAIVNIKGTKFLEKSFQTDTKGNALVTFALPDTLNTTDVLLNLIISNENNTQSENITRFVPVVLQNLAIQFMPEGGDLVENVSQNVAFKAIDMYGKGTDIEGEIWEENQKISTFKSYHQGMGSFELLHEANKNYFLHIKKPFLLKKSIPKPNPNKKIFLNAEIDTLDKNNILKTKFYVGNEETKNEKNFVYLILKSANKIVFSQKINVSKGLNLLDIDTKKMPIGIAQLTLFDKNQVPQAERLVFLNPNKKLNIDLKTNKTHYLPREQVKIALKTTDENKKPVSANVSLSVVNEQILNIADDKQHNMMSWLLLGSELKGNIDEPNFYFEEKNKKQKNLTKALDYLMLTHGWRTFQWKNVDLDKNKSKEYFVKFLPDKLSTISGKVIDKKLKPIPNAEVVLFTSKSSKEKITAKDLKGVIFKADEQGNFTIFNVNPQHQMILLARAKKYDFCDIVLDTNPENANIDKKYGLNEGMGNVIFEAKKYKNQIVSNKNLIPISTTALSLSPDVMEEVVVAGYGVRETTCGWETMQIKQDFASAPMASFDRAMQGRIAGVQLTEGQPGVASNIRIRGIGSISSGSSPLYIVDGVATNANNINNIVLENIESIDVLKDAPASAIYGAQAANGVVLINTKRTSKYGGFKEPYKYHSPYTKLIIVPNVVAPEREFYVPDYSKKEEQLVKNEQRTDFRDTIFWENEIQTDENGNAEISFYNADNITTYRISAEGFGGGLIGKNENTYFTQKSLQIDAVIPPFFTQQDTAQIAIQLQNNLDINLQADLKVAFLGKKMQILGNNFKDNFNLLTQKIDFLPKEKKVIYVSVFASDVSTNEKMEISLTSIYAQDHLSQTLQINTKGFPESFHFGNTAFSHEVTLTIPKHLKGTLKGEFSVFNSVTHELMTSVESMIREPYGCFEQVSSSTYPNILALQFMQETNSLKPEIKQKALQYIENGYKKLIAYEVKGGGFEWFGHSPAHEALTAYGLLEFLDMKKVYPNVDNEMIERTKKWLLSRKDGKGGFKKTSNSYFHGDEGEDTQNAYIVYALARAKVKNIEIEKEYEISYQKALKNKDKYQMSLMAMSSILLEKNENATKIMDYLAQQTQQEDLNTFTAKNTWTNGGGKANMIETVSSVGNGFLMYANNQKNKNFETQNKTNFNKITQFITNNKQNNMFGSTQSTICALQYLTDFSKNFIQPDKNNPTNGNVELWANEKLLTSVFIDPNNFSFEKKEDWIEKLGEGTHHIKVISKNLKNPLSFVGNIYFSTYTPKKSSECVLDLKTTLSQKTVNISQTTRLNISLKNLTEKTQASPIICVGIPSGLEVQAWQLKALQEKKVFDFYEIKENYVAFYYRSISPQETKNISLDLTAKMKGSFLSSASVAYLYYTSEYKDWEDGVKIIIE